MQPGLKIAFPSGDNPVYKLEVRVHTPNDVSCPFGMLRLPWPSAQSIMRLMANQVLMRIDSFISCNYVALCFPPAKPRRLKGKQDMAWGRLGM